MVPLLSTQVSASAGHMLRGLLPLSQHCCAWAYFSASSSNQKDKSERWHPVGGGSGGPPHSTILEALEASSSSALPPQQPAFPPGDQQRLLRVALVGYPNAGKSQLTNCLVGSRVTSVSPKRNTTIKPHLGAFCEGTRQVVLYDTPGLVQRFEQKHQPERVRSAWQTAAACDALLFIVDANAMFQYKHQAGLQLAQQLKDGPSNLPLEAWRCPPAVLVLNKQDKLPRDLRMQVMRSMEQLLMDGTPFQRCFWVSALHKQGIAPLRDYLLEQAVSGAWLLPAGQATNQDSGQMAVELVREKLFYSLHQELPYALMPQLRGKPVLLLDGRLRVVVVIRVRNEVQRSIVVGRQGSVVQGLVAEPVEAELAQLLGRPVSLLVEVQVQQRGQ